MYYRLVNAGVGFDRPHRNSVYKMLTHKARKRNPNRFRILQDSLQSSELDGLKTAKYKLNYIKKYPLFTYISVDVGNPPASQVIYNENEEFKNYE
jgi:hypothetical protein